MTGDAKLTNFAGCMLGGIGFLITFLSGTCSLVLWQSGTKIQGWRDVLIIAGPPLLGIGLIIIAIRSTPSKKEKLPPTPSDDEPDFGRRPAREESQE